MPRVRVRQTNRGTTSLQMMNDAVACVIENKRSIRSVAKQFGICHVSLYRFYKKSLKTSTDVVSFGYKSHNRVFTDDEEAKLGDYIKYTSDLYYGLTTKTVRNLAFQCAKKFEKKMPSTWIKNETAGKDWFSSFMERNKTLSIRKPEATSLSRAINFNRFNVNLFFDNLENVFDEHKFLIQNIYNVDETGVTTVLPPSKIVASKGKKQIGSIASAERGTLVTVCLAVSATGNTIPPMFVFPRVNFRDHFITDGPPGCIGSANKSGWMQREQFLEFVKHFAIYTHSSLTNKVLLILDNHESHLDIEVINFCRSNGIVMLSFPPHCSHKLQPLDRTVFGPFKKYLSDAQSGWLRLNPGKRVSIYA